MSAAIHESLEPRGRREASLGKCERGQRRKCGRLQVRKLASDWREEGASATTKALGELKGEWPRKTEVRGTTYSATEDGSLNYDQAMVMVQDCDRTKDRLRRSAEEIDGVLERFFEDSCLLGGKQLHLGESVSLRR